MTRFQHIIDFVRSLYPNKEFIALHEPYLAGNEKKYLQDCIDSTFVSSVGKYVDRFEEMVRDFTGAKYAVATVNGTSALHVALLLAGVKPGDLVITQPLTFVATCNAISYCGAEPVFIDIDLTTLGLSADALEAWLSKNVVLAEEDGKLEAYCLPRINTNEKTRMNTNDEMERGKDNFVEVVSSTENCEHATSQKARTQKNKIQPPDHKNQTASHTSFVDICDLSFVKIRGLTKISACLPMHTFGHPCEIDRIVEICKRYHIPVVEDSAESIGSYYKGKHTGTFGKLGILSFNGNKTISTGGGGMILTNDEELGKLAKHITTTAKKPHPWEFNHDLVAYNYRMPNVNAALGCAQMEQLEKILENKRETAARYRDFFAKQNGHCFVDEPPNSRSNFWLNAILLPSMEDRDLLLKATNEAGVMTRPAWKLMPSLPMFCSALRSELTVAKKVAATLINLPSSVRR